MEKSAEIIVVRLDHGRRIEPKKDNKACDHELGQGHRSWSHHWPDPLGKNRTASGARNFKEILREILRACPLIKKF
jgi:hypothetical protein